MMFKLVLVLTAVVIGRMVADRWSDPLGVAVAVFLIFAVGMVYNLSGRERE